MAPISSRGGFNLKLLVLFLLVAFVPLVLVSSLFLMETNYVTEMSQGQVANLSTEDLIDSISAGVWIVPSEQGNVSSVNDILRAFCDPARTLRIVVDRDETVRVGYIGSSDGVLVLWPDITGTLRGIKPPFDYRERPWYLKAKREGKTTWTRPYMDAGANTLAITCATPIYCQSNLVGVAGMDISLGALHRDMSNYSSGYLFLVDDEGVVVMRPLTEPEGFLWDELQTSESLFDSESLELAKVVQKMANGEIGSSVVRLNKGDCKIAYAPLTSVGWSLGIVSGDEELATAKAVQYDEAFRHIEDLNEIIAKSTAEAFLEDRSTIKVVDLEDRSTQPWSGRMKMMVLAIILVTGFLAGAIWIYVNRSIVRPTDSIIEAFDRVGKGDLDSRVDDMAVLSESFAEMITNLRHRFSQLEKDSFEEGSSQKEAEISNEIKQVLLPKRMPLIEGYEIAVLSFPECIKSGHFYDAFEIENERIGLVTTDASGEGIPAIMLALLSRTLIRTAFRKYEDPAEALREANLYISENSINGMMVACFCGLLDITCHVMKYANAGHAFPFVVSSQGVVDTLTSGGIALGALDRIDLVPEQRPMDPGDVLVIYNDSMTEAVNEKNEQFGTERLITLVKENRNSSASEILKIVESSIKDYTRNLKDNPLPIIIKRCE
ncbi:MAG: SpoIIE family protein phosphatase [Methanotrichaceae archaeon]